MEQTISRTHCDPQIFHGLAVWARIAFAGGDLRPYLEARLSHVAQNPRDASALLDISILSQLLGQRETGLEFQARALAIQTSFRVAAAQPTAKRLLAIVTPGDLAENNALEFLLEKSSVGLDLLFFPAISSAPITIPPHDVAMVGVCESDRNRPILKELETVLRTWPQPIVNRPELIARLSRDGASAMFSHVPGLHVPRTVRVDREFLTRLNDQAALTSLLEDEATFPIILRPIDTHKGQGQAKLDSAAAVLDYLRTRSETEFFAAPFVDYRSSDGQFRKYRILFLDGQPKLCHLAISSNWMVHYMNAGMLESAEKRAEEALAMRTFDDTFARRHREAFRYLSQAVQLEYFGIDCAETADGELLIFELDAGMTVHAMDSAEIYPYKRPQMQTVFQAFEQLILRRCRPEMNNHLRSA